MMTETLIRWALRYKFYNWAILPCALNWISLQFERQYYFQFNSVDMPANQITIHFTICFQAEVAELADALRSGRSGIYLMRVRLPPSAHRNRSGSLQGGFCLALNLRLISCMTHMLALNEMADMIERPSGGCLKY